MGENAPDAVPGIVKGERESRKMSLKQQRNRVRVRRAGESGAAILESMFTILILLLILFGIIQLFYLSLGKLYADYASFRGARSAAVGFKDYLVDREAKIQAIPASGPLTEFRTSAEFHSARTQFNYEKTMVPRFMNGYQWMNYQYWGGSDPLYHDDYHCAYYGMLMSESGAVNCSCKGCACDVPAVNVTTRRGGESVRTTFHFLRYPFTVPMYRLFTNKDSIDISGETRLSNHAASYLE